MPWYRVAFALVLATTARAQHSAPVAVWFDWRDPHIAIQPDSSGTFLWVRSGAAGDRTRPRYFEARFDPARIEAWISEAREFVIRPLGDADSGTVRSSNILLGNAGDGIYLARRQSDGVWSSERFIQMESPKDSAPLLIRGTEANILEILDSLRAVALRTPFSAAVARRTTAELTDTPVDRPARADPTNQPPRYPLNQLRANRDGLVIASFVVGVGGRVNMTTVRPILTSAPEFLDAVLGALPLLRFFPAELNGRLVESRVTMPFEFSLVRRPDGKAPE